MTPEQIETLKRLLESHDEWVAAAKKHNSDHHSDKKEVDYMSDRAAALRSALALAEQARAMEGWEAVTYLRGDTIATRQGDGQWYIEDETRFQYLGHEGVWAGFESREVFADKESAIAAANAAMKAGQA